MPPPCGMLSARHQWFQPLAGHTLCRRQAGASSCCPATCQASSPPITAGREGVWGPLRPHPHPHTPPAEPQGHWGTRVSCWPGLFPAPSICFGIHSPGISGEGFQNNLGSTEACFLGRLEIRYRKSLGSGKPQAWSCQGRGAGSLGRREG